MPNTTYSLDDIRAAADQKYGSSKIDLGSGRVVELRNIIRLSSEERAQFTNLAKKDENKDKDVTEVDLQKQLSDVLRILAGEEQAKVLLGVVGDHIDYMSEIIDRYMEDQKGPKAEGSQSSSTSTEEPSSETSTSTTD